MMTKNLCFTLGILGILLFSLGMVSSAVDNFELTIIGAGTTSNRLTGGNDTTHPFTINVENTNSTFGNIYVNWSVASTTNMVLPTGGIINLNTDQNITGFILTMPYASSSYKRLNAEIYSEDQSIFLGEENINIYFNNTDYVIPAQISGCTDPDATNYNPSATLDNGSCTYGSGDENETEESEYSCPVEVGDLEIVYFSVNNMGTGDDEEWNLLDEIELEVEVENDNRDDSVSDVLVEIVILDSNGEDVTQDFELDDEEIDLGRIRDRESEIAKFRIPELPADLEEGTYKVYIKAYSEDDEENQCASISDDFNKEDYQEIEVVREEDPAVFIKSDIIRMDVLCGEKNVIFSFDVYNLGSDDEKRVLVTLENSELGISQKQVISNLRSGKKKEVTFMFDIPEYLPKNAYDLSVKTYFDYDDDEDENEKESYDESSEDIGKRFSLRLDVLECSLPEPTISAKLNSEAKLGEDLIIGVTVLNNANVEQDVILSLEGYESWGSLVNIEPVASSIGAGQSKDFLITLIPEEEGRQSFTINVVADSETYKQQVSLDIGEQGSSFDFWGLDKVTFFLLVGIGILVLIIIIVLIVKLASRGSKD
jgi:hypothetical protein